MKGLTWSILGCFSQIEMTLKLLIQSFSSLPLPPPLSPWARVGVRRLCQHAAAAATSTGKSFVFVTPEDEMILSTIL